MKKLGFILGLVLLVTLNLNATSWEQQTGWVLAYENDKDGNTVSGNVESLIAAVRNGADIKVGSSDVFFKCNYTYIRDNSVICMNTEHVSQNGLDDNNLGFYPNSNYVFYMVKTTGVKASSGWFVGGGSSNVTTNRSREAIKWFVRTN
jgi:hypothetical protein